MKRKTPKPGRAAPRRATHLAPAVPLAPRLAELLLWGLLLVPPLLLVPTAKEAFRLPKLLASECFGLASLLPLAWRLREAERVEWRDLWRLPALRAALPLALVATVSLAATRYPLHVREALADLWIGAACLVGWSAGLPAARLERLLKGMLLPASVLALLGILQFHGVYRPLSFFGLTGGERLAVTSTAGNPGDLAAYLVLPCLIAQWTLAGWSGRRLAAWSGRRLAVGCGVALALCLYALAVTQTLAGVAAVALGTLAFWTLRLPRRRALAALAGAAAAAVLLVLAVPALRARVVEKSGQLARGEWNAVLTGRLDGWRAALWMLTEHPVAGVGHGAYRPEFTPAKIALLERGAPFYEGWRDPTFANAHNEILEVGADTGLLGLAALGWGLWTLLAALRRRSRADSGRAALAWSGAAALAVLSLAHFPFRIALVAFPALLFLAWALRPADTEGEAAA